MPPKVERAFDAIEVGLIWILQAASGLFVLAEKLILFGSPIVAIWFFYTYPEQWSRFKDWLWSFT